MWINGISTTKNSCCLCFGCIHGNKNEQKKKNKTLTIMMMMRSLSKDNQKEHLGSFHTFCSGYRIIFVVLCFSTFPDSVHSVFILLCGKNTFIDRWLLTLNVCVLCVHLKVWPFFPSTHEIRNEVYFSECFLSISVSQPVTYTQCKLELFLTNLL